MKEHFIYVIGRVEGPVKIGITSALGARLATLQTGCPYKIEVIYARACRDRESALSHERAFHEDNAENRLAGEWFDLDGEYAAEEIDASIDIEIWREDERRREVMAAYLNIWPWAGENGAHSNH